MSVASPDGLPLPSAERLLAFLSRHGWTEVARAHDASLWHAPYDKHVEVVVPLDPDLPDAERQLVRALDDVAVATSVPTREIALNVLRSQADVLRVRDSVETPDDGSISYAHAQSMMNGIRDLLVASAAATDMKRPYFGKRKKHRASRVAETLQMGHTERGSFTMTVVVPEPFSEAPGGEQTLVTEPAYSYQRRVFITLARAITAVRTATDSAHTDANYAPFLDGVISGISADLCQALTRLIGAARAPSSVAVTIDWGSATSPTQALAGEVSFAPRDVPVLGEAIARLRPGYEDLQREIEGRVIGLRLGEDETEGVATVRTIVQGERHLVRVPLQGLDHSAAVRAYEQKADLHLTGDLVREGTLYYLFNATRGRGPVQGEIEADPPVSDNSPSDGMEELRPRPGRD